LPASPLLPAAAYVVLPKENHMLLAEAATLERKSGAAERALHRSSRALGLGFDTFKTDAIDRSLYEQCSLFAHTASAERTHWT
jgi:hypothetical protein